MIKATKNFYYYEFRPHGAPKSWVPSNAWMKLLVDTLAGNLQIVRNNMPGGSVLNISSGVRLSDDFKRLVGLGYKPSSTTDHNYGFSAPLEIGSEKCEKYGETYNFSIGAADVVPGGMSVRDLFNLVRRLIKEGKCFFGQVIYEYCPKQKKEWIHFSNDEKIFFSNDVCRFLNRYKYLESLDGGKTYQVVAV